MDSGVGRELHPTPKETLREKYQSLGSFSLKVTLVVAFWSVSGCSGHYTHHMLQFDPPIGLLVVHDREIMTPQNDIRTSGAR